MHEKKGPEAWSEERKLSSQRWLVVANCCKE